MNYMEAAFAPAERIYARNMMHSTWGHLAPLPDNVYVGWILFTHGCYGDQIIINYKFVDGKGRELDSSPWLYEDLNRFVGDSILPPRANKCRLPEGRIYKFIGSYTKAEDHPKIGNSVLMVEGEGRFRGRIRRVKA